MKNALCKFFLIFFITLGAISITSNASAAYRCTWVGGYWHHGYYYPAHKVCQGYYNYRYKCGWTKGHWYRGNWYQGHRYCWR